jgi:hypothetical protein
VPVSLGEQSSLAENPQTSGPQLREVDRSLHELTAAERRSHLARSEVHQSVDSPGIETAGRTKDSPACLVLETSNDPGTRYPQPAVFMPSGDDVCVTGGWQEPEGRRLGLARWRHADLANGRPPRDYLGLQPDCSPGAAPMRHWVNFTEMLHLNFTVTPASTRLWNLDFHELLERV